VNRGPAEPAPAYDIIQIWYKVSPLRAALRQRARHAFVHSAGRQL
jgi:hypothetical protein